MKRVLAILIAAAMLLFTFPAAAEEGNVTYSGDAGKCIFAPGSDYSPTDLFPNFKDVMPGDSLTQKITVRNDASNKVKVKIYMRALGAHEGSEEFLSQLNLTVQKNANDEMSYMFDGPADETLHLTNWVCLGTLYSGGKVDLDVTLNVPVELDNTYKNLIGYLDWEFMIEEFPVEDTDPEPPDTGDHSMLWLWILLLVVSGGLMIFLAARKKQQR